MIYLHRWVCGGLAKIRSANSCIVVNFNYVAYQQTVFDPVDYISGFAVFVQYRGSNLPGLDKIFNQLISFLKNDTLF